MTAGRWTRLLLVGATLFGLAVMHTLGHGTHAGGHEPVASVHDGVWAHEGTVAVSVEEDVAAASAHEGTGPGQEDMAVASAHGATGVAAVGSAAPPPGAMVGDHDATGDVRLVAAVVPGDAGCPTGCPHEPLLSAGGTGGGFPEWGVCLAVLGAFGMALLLAVLLGTVTGAGEPGRRSGDRPPGASRAPPPRPVGLRLAAVSVLRGSVAARCTLLRAPVVSRTSRNRKAQP